MTDIKTPAGSLFSDRRFIAVWTVGILVSVVRWLEFLSVGIFAYDVTGSAFLVALLALLRFLPLALFGSVLGALGDMMDSARLLCITMAVACLVSLVMTALFVMGIADYWHVAVSVFLSGIFWASDQPLRRKLIGRSRGWNVSDAHGYGHGHIQRVPPGRTASGRHNLSMDRRRRDFRHCRRALRLGPVLMMSVRRFEDAPAVAGFDPWRPYWRLAGDTVCLGKPGNTLHPWSHSGVQYLGLPMLSMVPVIGKEELELSPSLVGMISALEGGSALIGALTIARFVQPPFYRKLYFSGVCALLVIIFTMGQFPGLTSLVLGLIGAGFAGACFSTMQSTLTYLAAPPEMRGRLLGLITICIGSGLIGFANIGLMAEWFGASTALSIVAIEGAVPMVMIGLI